MPTISVAPVRKSVLVQAPPDRAFALFADIGRWWPASHSINPAGFRTVTIEPRARGRWFETGKDGSQCEIGHVLAWEPPQRLLLAWQLGVDFKFDAGLVSEVELRFTAEGEGTRVDLEHRHLERMGARAAALRDSIDSPNGWGAILALYAQSARE